MKRRLSNILSALSLLLCMAAIALWPTSYWVEHSVSYTRLQATKTEHLYTSVAMGDGQGWLAMGFDRWHDTKGLGYFNEVGWNFGALRPPSLPWERETTLCVIHESWSTPLTGQSRAMYGIMLPYWVLIPLSGTMPTLWFLRKRKQRRKERLGLCLRCGYDLRASKDRCPECGTPTRATESKA